MTKDIETHISELVALASRKMIIYEGLYDTIFLKCLTTGELWPFGSRETARAWCRMIYGAMVVAEYEGPLNTTNPTWTAPEDFEWAEPSMVGGPGRTM